MAKIEWLGHATFRITGAGKTVYIDPWKLKGGEPKADLILISHSHYDHLSPDDIDKISTPETVILGASDVAGKVTENFKTLRPGESQTVAGIKVTGTHAYNLSKQFHPKANGWLGFLIALDDRVIYYSGDSDLTPEMEKLGKVDVALLPIGGTYTMTAEEAAQAAQKIKSGRCIPYHYGDIVGTADDAQRFKKLCPCETSIVAPGSGVEV